MSIFIALLIALSLGVGGCAADITESPAPTATIESVTTPKPTPEELVTMENFNRISTGMTLSQVEAILGKGTLSAQDDYGGTQYSWKGSGISVVVIGFMEGKVVTKTQAGLK